MTRLTLEEALAAARETRSLEIGQSNLSVVPQVFLRHFDQQPAVVVADVHTFQAAGNRVVDALRAAGQDTLEPFVFTDSDLYAEHRFVERLEEFFKTHTAVPVAVGSGTINDLVKLAAHRTGRQYVCVATAASMDGYTAYGASITWQGSKQTFDCPAPIAVVADLDVIAQAPAEMKAWGYADLLAKVTAGADWIVADVLGVEPIEPLAWNIVQGGLHDAVGSPALVRAGDRAALGKLVTGLMLGGFAMQSMRSSRPASGAEHQFSHLWDMEHHTYQGKAPSHGLKVGIGTIAVTALYERLLSSGQTPPVIPEDALARWPESDRWRVLALELFDDPLLQELAVRETLAKLPDATELQRQLTQLVQRWPELQQRLTQQLIPLDRLRSMLRAVGAPVNSEKIGISRERLRESYRKALMIRRRFTVLDLVARMGRFDQMLQELFTATGGGALAGGRQSQDNP